MASLKDYKSRYESDSKDASNINRSLALGGIAVIWIFKHTDVNGVTSLPPSLLWPLLLLVFSLAIDFSQYVVSTLIWWVFFRINERKVKKGHIKEDEIKHGFLRPNIGWGFWIAKIISMTIAYLLLLKFVINKLF